MRQILLILLLVLNFSFLSAQNIRKLNREGVNAYRDSAYSEAELKFRKALEADSSSMEAIYNIANTLYKQNRYEEAGKIYEELSSTIEEKEYLSELHHNLGNSFLKKEDYQKSIEAYKNALRLAPGDDETRYNLAYAKAKLKQQQQEQQQQEQQQNQDQDKQDQEQDKQQNEDQKQDQEEKQDQQQNRDQQQEKNEEQQQQQQQAQAMKSLSKEDMERLLQAIQQQEKKVQEKLEKEKAKAPKTKTEKDW